MFNNKLAKRLRLFLLPFSLLYGIVIGIRHKLFDWKLLKEKEYSLPIICVGNIAIGGTGKTPHIEFLIELLKEKVKLAVLSRGYKRITTGYVRADRKATPGLIGDEPFQIFRKYNTTVAVCENRVEGIEKLLEEDNKPEAILLDDAFQHRYVKAGMNIVLMDYSQPLFKDFLLPAGNLRDTKSQIKRAHIVLVTKCPEKLGEHEHTYWMDQLRLNANQQLFFTSIDYGIPDAVFTKKDKTFTLDDLKKEKATILLVSGIANPKPLIKHLEHYQLDYQLMQFPDHHNFSDKDLQKIRGQFDSISGRKKIIITTEKDAVRFKYSSNFPRSLKDKIYYIPIKIKTINDYQHNFEKTITEYAAKNK